MPTAYVPRRAARSDFVALRGLRHHLLSWGDASLVTPQRPPLLMMHGWMDVGASYQFTVDALAEPRYVIAADWRGFGLTDANPGDCYWFADYLGDLDALIDHLSPEQPIDLVGHSMGGNIVGLYAGARAPRVAKLVIHRRGMANQSDARAAQQVGAFVEQDFESKSYFVHDVLYCGVGRRFTPTWEFDLFIRGARRWSDSHSPLAAQADSRPEKRRPAIPAMSSRRSADRAP